MKIKTKTLPSIRITDDTIESIQLAISKLNEKSIIPITLQEYRRVCYLFTSQSILEGKEIKIMQS